LTCWRMLVHAEDMTTTRNHGLREARSAIAAEIQEMITLRNKGHLKRSGDDFISGLIKAYALLINETDLDKAYTDAMAQ
jgi:hypothetical protein